MLSERRKKILQAVIDEYIENATPIGSKAIQETYFSELSPATIRNELASLEEMGLLSHPHTSAGRVPTNLAYKMYIDELVDNTKVTESELNEIKEYFTANMKETEYVANQVVKVLSDMTNYTSVASIKGGENEEISSIRLVKLSDNVIVMIAVMASGEVNDFRIYGNYLKGDGYVASAEKVLSKHLIGKTFDELDGIDDLVKGEFSEFKELFTQIYEVVKARGTKKGSVLLEGESKIFSHPEYSNIKNVKDFLSVVDSKETIKELLSVGGGDVDIAVTFGGESEEIPKDFTVVTAHYTQGDKDLGTFGVIGPTRMDYNRVIKVLSGIREVLSEENKDE